MADNNKFSMAQLALTILTTSLLVGGAMYSVTSKLILAEAMSEINSITIELKDRMVVNHSALEARLDNKLGYSNSAIRRLEDIVHRIEKQVATLQHQQSVDAEINAMVNSIAAQVQDLRTEIALINLRTSSIADLAKRVVELNSQVTHLREKVEDKKQ